MDIVIMSRKELLDFEKCYNKIKSSVITITDISNKNKIIVFNNQFSGIMKCLYLYFDDVEQGENNCITDEDAKTIKLFVDNIKGYSDLLIVSCDGGVSRSAGVGAAIMKAINNDDSKVFNDSSKCPNETCYRKVLKQFMDIDEVELRDKFKHNLDIWIKAQEV